MDWIKVTLDTMPHEMKDIFIVVEKNGKQNVLLCAWWTGSFFSHFSFPCHKQPKDVKVTHWSYGVKENIQHPEPAED